MTDKLIERLSEAQALYEASGLHGENGAKIMKDAKARILADAEVIKATLSVISDILDERDHYKALAKRAEKALVPFAGCVFNDNGDMTVSDTHRLTHDDYARAYFAHKRLSQIDAEPAEPHQHTVQEAARVLLQGGDYLTFAPAFSAMDQRFDEGPEVAFAAALRALAEGDSQ